MGKYEDSSKIILGLFGSPAWIDKGVVTHPSNFTGSVPGNRYIRVSVIQSSPKPIYARLDGISGQLIVEIFTTVGEGPAAAQQIADLLDGLLVGKLQSSDSGYVQMGLSFLTSYGVDKANPALYRHIYNLSFTYFGK